MSQLDRATAVHDELIEARDALKLNKQPVATVHLGLGYFAQMANEDAIKTVERQIERAKQSLIQVRELNGLSEEGLPIMEILEKLDEDGNVVESSVQSTNSSLPTIQSALKSLDTKRREQQREESSSQAADSSMPAQTAKIVEVSTETETETKQGENRIDDANLSVNNGEISDKNETQTSSTYNGLTDEDILHLELSGSEFEEEDFDEDDYGEISDSESDAEFVNASLFPQTSKVSQRLAEELEKQRIKVKQAKSVQFDQKLDIKEFNTKEPPSASDDKSLEQAQQSSDLQKRAMQYFEQSFINDNEFLELHDNQAIPEAKPEPKPVKLDDRDILSDISERSADAAASQPSNDLIEDRQMRAKYHSKRRTLIQKAGGYKVTEAEQATEPLAPPKQKVSRFKAARLASMN